MVYSPMANDDDAEIRRYNNSKPMLACDPQNIPIKVILRSPQI